MHESAMQQDPDALRSLQIYLPIMLLSRPTKSSKLGTTTYAFEPENLLAL